ncbi:uncharacterized protein LAESUDRAFT_758101 [Laetiporus sulphureus 93-53]|uniref:BTB domain-containing protein n=1 Tax=Laetiporus sulphureus 93-53 TaxID=1314785 RepID=A0A165EYA3_9APHY|nr:uncharacterized protein LAESUDRAFT_758101 [Laetiporus sulphureus 93-53]KZT07972.1 hypothetical protein LAESUDRAFT_758101 [Laetiporus sulphureus 93-53]
MGPMHKSTSGTRKHIERKNATGPRHVGNSDYKRDKELWYEDGSIILTARGIGFRVYKGLLAAQSVVFRSLFNDTQPEEFDPVDGCPIIHFSEHPDEFRHLLCALMRGHGFLRRDIPVPFEVIATLVRLGEEYEICELCDAALNRLKTHFTDSFHVFCGRLGDEPEIPPMITMQESDAIAVVNLARLTETDNMLPTALYGCCQLDKLVLSKGVTRLGGTVEALSEEDLARCMDGIAHLASQNAHGLHTTFCLQTSEQCSDPRSCTKLIKAIPNEILKCQSLARTSVLSSWDKYIEAANLLCKHCQKTLYERELVRRRTVWRALPEHMGVTVEVWEVSGVASAS